MNLDTLLTPGELPALARRDLRDAVCVVFDVLRATSTFVTALHHGARAVIPVCEIAEAVALRRERPDVKLAGERDGVRISAALTGGDDFDFGNSPREFTPARVQDQTIVSTTTNGTRALRACARAKTVLAASFLNLAATAAALRGEKHLVLVCAGTGENAAMEDVLAAGALVESLLPRVTDRPALWQVAASTKLSFAHLKADLAAALGSTENGRRLLARPELRDDVAFCAQLNVFNLVARLHADGALRRD